MIFPPLPVRPRLRRSSSAETQSSREMVAKTRKSSATKTTSRTPKKKAADPLQAERQQWVGTKIKKSFQGEWYEGVVKDVWKEGQKTWYRITYKDGDVEDMSKAVMRKHAIGNSVRTEDLEAADPALFNAVQKYKNRTVEKTLWGGKVVQGKVKDLRRDATNPNRLIFKLGFARGQTDEVGLRELYHLLVDENASASREPSEEQNSEGMDVVSEDVEDKAAEGEEEEEPDQVNATPTKGQDLVTIEDQHSIATHSPEDAVVTSPAGSI